MRLLFTCLSSIVYPAILETATDRYERYKDQAASDAHLKAAPVQKLLKYFGDEAPLVGAPEVHNLNPAVDFRRPIAEAKPGMIYLFAHLGYQSGKVSEGLVNLKDLIKTCSETEPGFYGCTGCVDKEKELIRVVDIFESDDFYEKEHVKSAAIAKFHQQHAPLGNGDFSVVKLKVVQGFLGR